MLRLWFVLVLTCAACSPAYFQPPQPGIDYRLQIETWQQKIRQKGWSEALVDEIMTTCVMLSKYEPDPKDQDVWMTYQEFTETFQGDCEDIATFMYGTLKRLDYPRDVRLRILRMPLGDHVVVMVQLPGGRWKMFNSVPIAGDIIDIAVSRTLVEWDDDKIYYPGSR